MPDLSFQLLHPRFQLVNGVPKNFHYVVCDGSHCGLDGRGGGLTKAEEGLASYRIVYGS